MKPTIESLLVRGRVFPELEEPVRLLVESDDSSRMKSITFKEINFNIGSGEKSEEGGATLVGETFVVGLVPISNMKTKFYLAWRNEVST